MISVEQSILELKNKKPIIIFDKDNENEGDLVFPSEIINIEILNFISTCFMGLEFWIKQLIY